MSSRTNHAAIPVFLSVISTCLNAAFAGDDVVINDFEADTFGNWTVEGDAFGIGPVQGSVEGQMPVSGVLGKGVANSFVHGDGATGVLTSPEFLITRNHLAFLIGGGKIPDELGPCRQLESCTLEASADRSAR